MKGEKVVKIEERTARLTILIDPRKKAVFERLCVEEDLTPSQVLRRLIRSYIEQRFLVTATRQTTEEFLRDLLQDADVSLAQHQALLGEFLHQCDFVKFAALSLTLNNMEGLRQSARTFVLETSKPEPMLTMSPITDAAFFDAIASAMAR